MVENDERVEAARGQASPLANQHFLFSIFPIGIIPLGLLISESTLFGFSVKLRDQVKGIMRVLGESSRA